MRHFTRRCTWPCDNDKDTVVTLVYNVVFTENIHHKFLLQVGPSFDRFNGDTVRIWCGLYAHMLVIITSLVNFSNLFLFLFLCELVNVGGEEAGML